MANRSAHLGTGMGSDRIHPDGGGQMAGQTPEMAGPGTDSVSVCGAGREPWSPSGDAVLPAQDRDAILSDRYAFDPCGTGPFAAECVLLENLCPLNLVFGKKEDKVPK